MEKLIKLLEKFDLSGNSLLIEDLDPAPQEKTTEGGIILGTAKREEIELHKARVLKAGLGHHSDYGEFIYNPIKENALIYYKNAREYILEGISFKGTELGQVVAYKNENGNSEAKSGI